MVPGLFDPEPLGSMVLTFVFIEDSTVGLEFLLATDFAGPLGVKQDKDPVSTTLPDRLSPPIFDREDG